MIALAICDVHGRYYPRSFLLSLFAESRVHFGTVALVAGTVSVGIGLFLVFHVVLLAANLTSIELHEKRGFSCRPQVRRCPAARCRCTPPS